MTPGIILDLIVLGIIVVFVIRGLSRGLIMSLSGMVAMVAGIFGGTFIAEKFSGWLAKAWICPRVLKSLNLAAEGGGIPQGAVLEGGGGLTDAASDSLSGIMESSSLPRFSFEGTIDIIGKQISDTGKDILEAAAEVISERIAYILLFIVAFAVIQVLVRLVFRLISLIGKAPVLNTLNRLAGGALGLISGLLLVTLIMWVGVTFIKPATEPG
ncbi:MAG: CvpA family protein, partial [Clostridiales bacterium]|nr:CvpA family protein [Clostridiales bacterium]